MPISRQKTQEQLSTERTGGRQDVRINMTAEEFRHWMDDTNDNGVVDTRREIENALGGIDDNTELSIMTDEDVKSMMDRVLGMQNNNN